MISLLNRNVVVPCRQTLAQMIYQEFQIQKAFQINAFASINSKISLTLDLWTSESDDPYIGIMAHFLDTNWNHQTKLLSISTFDHPHTGEAIGQKIIDVTNEYTITNKILSITTDNAKNMINAYEFFSAYVHSTYFFKPLQRAYLISTGTRSISC